ncbi:MAG: KTSC domain-containing protein [Steroidobacteraceae bacterium]
MPSTVIRQILYDIESRRLVLVFQSGRRYGYFNVPPDVYEELRAAPSRGAYFNEWIRDQYPFQCLDPDYVPSEHIQ